VVKTRAVLCVGLLLLCVSGVSTAELTSQDVTRSINRAVEYLRSSQQSDGHWRYTNAQFSPGVTGLCVLALNAAGLPSDDPAVARGLRYLEANGNVPSRRTYQYACIMMAMSACDPVRYRKAIVSYARWLCQAQLANGMWSYDGQGRGDNSNTQFALLGLLAAIDAGIEIPRGVLRAANDHFRSTQLKDGGWGYVPGQANPTGSMTSAGTAALYITGAVLSRSEPDCVRSTQDVSAEGGLAWLANNWSVSGNPRRGPAWHYYYLYGLERVGVLSARRTIGGHDWFREGGAFLVAGQAANGSWGGANLDTSFAILFLAKGRSPVVVQKLARPGDWNVHPHDIANLMAFTGKEIGKSVGWQIVDSNAGLDSWLEAPILYLNGRNTLTLDVNTKAKLKRFVESGGTVFAETVCGTRTFDRSFRQLVRELFDGANLQPLHPDHGVFNSHFKLRAGRRIEGLNYGCRTAIIYIPKAGATVWEANTTTAEEFKVGANVILYAVDKEGLSDKLADNPRTFQGAAEKHSGAFSVGQIISGDDGFTDLTAMPKLLAFCADRLNMNVSTRPRSLSLRDRDLFAFAVLYFEGHASFELAPNEIDRLRLFLDRGGFLLAEARCGTAAFDVSFRQLAAKLYPDYPLSRLPLDHKIYLAAFDATKVHYRKALREEEPRGQPLLEGVAVDNRLVIVYTKYDLGSGWNGEICSLIRGLEPQSALPLGANILVYALTH